ncbi:hypothetical protein C8A00DRAFT_37445 [Chaetomidium leptoderma]|uniref:Uncharacterized protein n=1 Tax=Chaetomidium leptoderma TaxID=669021 RepID=A0AAN6VGY9_9PEZI|nr:hypothetical protein C8A00DRAFT_37445 [Chaetomidium leptoderma]
MSGIVNKIKEAVHSDKSHHDQPEGTSGPHSSRVANAADPRVDSDRDHSSTIGAGRTHGAPEGTYGPHGSRVANAADPRVDSDRDNSRTVGGAGRTAGQGEFGSTGHTGAGHTGIGGAGLGSTGHTGVGRTAGQGEFGSTGHTGIGSTGHTGFGSSGTAEGVQGPHSSRVANAMDPRVDSDMDNSRTMGTGRTAGTGTTGFGSSQHTTGGIGSGGAGLGSAHHTAGGVGSAGTTGMTGTHGTHGTHGTGPGPAANTAGPHSNDMANKLDPRVDSDLDGSKTVGGNKTYQFGNNTSTYRDPTDAAQVPPSVLQRHVGGPMIEHDDVGHHRERRNSIKTHQESFSGI